MIDIYLTANRFQLETEKHVSICICGSQLKAMTTSQRIADTAKRLLADHPEYSAHYSLEDLETFICNGGIYCDVCMAKLSIEDTVYDCPEGYSQIHSGGFDVCGDCVDTNQVAEHHNLTPRVYICMLEGQFRTHFFSKCM